MTIDARSFALRSDASIERLRAIERRRKVAQWPLLIVTVVAQLVMPVGVWCWVGDLTTQDSVNGTRVPNVEFDPVMERNVGMAAAALVAVALAVLVWAN